MIRRYIYLGISDSNQFKAVETPGLLYLCAARYEDYVLLYAETDGTAFDPDKSVIGKTIPFPQGQHWMRVPQIFYYNCPKNLEQWARKGPSTPKFQVARLKEDCVAPYVYYHYQLQEEERVRRNKYTLIGLLGTLLVYYQEDPPVIGEPRPGSLPTQNTPKDWSRLMQAYFETEWQMADVLPDVLWKHQEMFPTLRY